MPPAVKSKRKEVDENLIPQNIEAEEAILGAILVNPSCLQRFLILFMQGVFTNLLTDIFTKQ